MSPKLTKNGGELFIVDNSDEEWKVHNYLSQWCDVARAIDIATGYFEIGALLALDGQWQPLEKLRILMGDEVSKRTQKAFAAALSHIAAKLDASLETAKEADDFLSGVPAIVKAIQSGQIQTRVYRQRKFHAKAYITHSKFDVMGSSALVGSSNFTVPGLFQNIELNIQIRREVEELQAWYERHWEEAEDVTPEILRIIEKHTRNFPPFEVYAKAMAEYFRGHELTVGEWERSESAIFPILSQYQREGYQALIEIARRYNGALLCDGVGLGKTFIGLMVIERLLFERKNVALIVPKTAREDVWETKLRQFLPRALRQTSNLFIYNHTDLMRGGNFPQYMQEIKEDFDAIVIDEAHHFRNLSSQRSQKLFELSESKQLFLLTATPINNSLYDLMHLIEYFSRRKPDYFRDRLGIYTLRGHFRQMETAIDSLLNGNGASAAELDTVAANEILARDDLFRELVVQRSRAYVKRSLEQDSDQAVAFPIRHDPQVANYSLVETYGSLLQLLETAFHKGEPLLTLGIYNPIRYLYSSAEQEAVDEFERGRLSQVVALIRTLLLKRFESSAVAFEASCEDLLLKLLYFVRLHNPKTAERWERQHAALMHRLREHKQQFGLASSVDDDDLDEDIVPEEFKRKIGLLNQQKYNVASMVMDTLLDMDELAKFLRELVDFDPVNDDKLQTLIRLLKQDAILRTQKVLIFTEFINTARYLQEQLSAAGIEPLAEVDSLSENRSAIIQAFAPYYNGGSSAELAAQGIQEIRILIATDVLSEGLNLQDATCIINYDLHWNPVRLMQRIGRVDRRLEPRVEQQIVADHRSAALVRGSIRLWNFLPPAEMNRILSLYERVTHKTLRISKTFGIEGRKLLTPEDDYEALREFNHAYEGQTTALEEMRLTYQRMLRDDPALTARLDAMPLRVFSGKEHIALEARGVFFCCGLPARDADTGEWTDAAGVTRWYLLDLDSGEISEDPVRIFPLIRCAPETPRQTHLPRQELTSLRRKLDQHITNTYLKKVQAPVGVTAKLLAWMELV